MFYFMKRQRIKRLQKKIKNMQQARFNNTVDESQLIKERHLYQELAKIYESFIGHRDMPYAQVFQHACYRISADIDDVEAKFWLGRHLLEEAKVRHQLQQEQIFANRINERNMKQQFEEAHAWLQAAQQFNHVESIRLQGLAYINGWGVPVDKDKGFSMVVNSIEIENTWDKIPEIFARIGLNKPEFFSALTSHRKQKNNQA